MKRSICVLVGILLGILCLSAHAMDQTPLPGSGNICTISDTPAGYDQGTMGPGTGVWVGSTKLNFCLQGNVQVWTGTAWYVGHWDGSNFEGHWYDGRSYGKSWGCKPVNGGYTYYGTFKLEVLDKPLPDHPTYGGAKVGTVAEETRTYCKYPNKIKKGYAGWVGWPA